MELELAAKRRADASAAAASEAEQLWRGDVARLEQRRNRDAHGNGNGARSSSVPSARSKLRAVNSLDPDHANTTRALPRVASLSSGAAASPTSPGNKSGANSSRFPPIGSPNTVSAAPAQLSPQSPRRQQSLKMIQEAKGTEGPSAADSSSRREISQRTVSEPAADISAGGGS